MAGFPSSIIEFQRQFPDDSACAAYLFKVRWPDGFICPACGHRKAWSLSCKADTFECAHCHKQTSVRAGTVMHGSKLSLTVWFWAAYLIATHSNGMSARQLKHQLGIGSYKSAWLLCAKLRRAMVDPDRSPLRGLVEVDETSIPFRRKDDPPAGGQGRSAVGKIAVIGAVEILKNNQGHEVPGRLRLTPIPDFSAVTLESFVTGMIETKSTVRTDGWSGYTGLKEHAHEPHVVGVIAAHIVLPWIHRVFANLKRWGLGVYHGLRDKHLQSYLDEFTFRFNRRRTPKAAFDSLLSIGTRIKPTTYNMLISPEAKG